MTISAKLAAMLLEVNGAGELLLPAELVQTPHTQFSADRHGDAIHAEADRPRRLANILDRLPAIHGCLMGRTETRLNEDLYEVEARERRFPRDEHSRMCSLSQLALHAARRGPTSRTRRYRPPPTIPV